MLNWEDVLAPMAWLHERIGLRPSRQSLVSAQALFASEPYLQQALSAIETQLIELLRIASAMGPTYVVTERSLKYMEATCALFFPSLALWLRHNSSTHVRVLAAPRTKFTSEMEKAAWRVDLLQSICRDVVAHNASPGIQQSMLRSPEFGTLGLIQVSACEMDTLACIKAIDVAPFLIPKCVYMTQQQPEKAARLSLEEFFAQLRMLQRYVVSAAAHSSAFAVNL